MQVVIARDRNDGNNADLDEVALPLALVAHEMRNPLAAIEMCLLAFERRMQANASLSAEAWPFVDRLRRNTRLLTRLTNDLLTASGSRELAETLQRRPTDLVSIVAHVLSAVPEGAGVSFMDRPSGPAVVHADDDRISQVVSNLVRNGLEHGRGPVTVSLRPAPGGWHLIVENDGDVPAELRDRLFEPFVRGRTRGRGLGLGLFLVRRFVEAHGGSIAFHCQSGRVAFVVFLPA
jgi:two-component system sensor histidine kinase/response regulator